MVIFLYGGDNYRSRQKLDEIVAHYKESKKSGLNLVWLDAKEVEFGDFYQMFKISPMFAEKKLVILKNVFANKPFQEEFAKELKTIEGFADVVVVYEAEAPDARLKLFKALLKECKCQEFDFLSGAALKKWALGEFEKLKPASTEGSGQAKQKINLDALDLLLNYAGNDLWRLSGEINKLANLKAGGTIKKDDVELLVRPRIELDIFKTIDALAAKNKPLALALLHKHLDGGEAALYLLSMVAFQFKNLLIVKELAEKGLMYASIVKKSGLHPFVVKKTYFACTQFSLAELKTIYRRIFEIDFEIKTGRIEAETALDLLVAQI